MIVHLMHGRMARTRRTDLRSCRVARHTRTIFLTQGGSVCAFFVGENGDHLHPLQEEHACMTKAELVDCVAERVQLPKYQTEMVVTMVLQCIMDALRAVMDQV